MNDPQRHWVKPTGDTAWRSRPTGPELLAPAGTLKHLGFALAYGADAIYAGQPRYSLRVRNNSFHRLAVLAEGIRSTHAAGKAFYLAANVAPHNAKIATFRRDMEPVIALGPDALILSDPGLILLAREAWPELPIHLSVQANTVNSAAVRFWAQQGIRRIILSRELALDEIAAIRQDCPDTELEVFVHGALCIAYSGRCLLSGYLNHRDPNQGACTNACRWGYRVHGTGHPSAEAAGAVQTSDPTSGETDSPFWVEQTDRPGERMPFDEDEHGTYVFNSKDLRAVQHVARLTAMGIDSVKIEGRTKSPYYVARTAQVYRRAIDDACAGRDFDPALMTDLEHLASRGYTEGFLRRHPPEDHQNYHQGASRDRTRQFAGEVIAGDAERWTIDVKNRLQANDAVELMYPTGNHTFRLEDLRDPTGRPVSVAPGSGYRVTIPAPRPEPPNHALILRVLDAAPESSPTR